MWCAPVCAPRSTAVLQQRDGGHHHHHHFHAHAQGCARAPGTGRAVGWIRTMVGGMCNGNIPRERVGFGRVGSEIWEGRGCKVGGSQPRHVLGRAKGKLDAAWPSRTAVLLLLCGCTIVVVFFVLRKKQIPVCSFLHVSHEPSFLRTTNSPQIDRDDSLHSRTCAHTQ